MTTSLGSLSGTSNKNINLIIEPIPCWRSTPLRADKADGVRVIDHDQGAMTLRSVADFWQIRGRAIHGKNAICYNEHRSAVTCLS